MPPDTRNSTWRQEAACTGLDPARWYPERGQPAGEAKAICASCPVQPMCLEHAIHARETHGLWGGASERERRRLRPVFEGRAHDWRVGCDCDWCGIVNEMAARLAAGVEGAHAGPVWVNGPNARHGYRATYARGCRCGLCSFRMSVAGQRLAEFGVDVPGWWWWWFRSRRDRGLLWKAMVLAYSDLRDGYGLRGAA